MRDNLVVLVFLLLVAVMISLIRSEKSGSSEFLILPLKVQEITTVTAPSKLRFRHNVSLTVSLTAGTPPQNVTMVLDTGSELSWLHCNKSQNYPQTFAPGLSGSYAPVRCSSPVCTDRTRDFPIPAGCDSAGLCHVTLAYADFSSAEGNLAADVFSLSLSGGGDRVVFGCMSSGYSATADEDAKSAGLIGMNLGSLSLVSQMAFPKFSYCISASGDASGVLLLGDAAAAAGVGAVAPPLNYTPMVRVSDPLPYYDRAAYTVRLAAIEVGGRAAAVPASVLVPDHTGAGQTIVDSGTQFTFLLGPAYEALRKEFLNQTASVLTALGREDFVFQGAMDLCYLVPLARPKLPPLPPVTLVFDGARMTVSDQSLLFRVPGVVRGASSVHCFTFGNSDLLGVEAFLIGHHHQQNMWMEFDLERSRIGFAQTRCDLAVQRLGLKIA